MKRFALLLLALGAGAVLSCSSPSRPAEKDTLYRHLVGDPATLDPTTTNEESGLLVEEMIFRPLLGIDRQRRFVQALAVSWTVSADGLVYSFRLDPKARWEDGSPVTSADVAATIERVRDPKVPAVTWRSALEGLAAVETPDPLTVVVRFRRPYAERLLAFTMPIVSAAAMTRPAELDRKPFGSGPYRLVSWESNQKLTLERRGDGSASDLPFRRMVFRVIPDAAVWFRAGTLGDLDEFRITRAQRPVAAASAEFTSQNRILSVPQFLVVVAIWNCRNPLLADPRVRRALALAWPRAETARLLYPPEGAALMSGPYPSGVAENASNVAPPPYDPGASAALLEQSGLILAADGLRRKGGRRASLELLFPAGQTIYTNLAAILRSAYGKVGVELTERPLDWAAYAQRSEAGEFDALLTGRLFLPPNLDPYRYYHSRQAPPNGENSGFYSNAGADRVMEAAQREMDAGKRLELYRQVHRLLAADPPADFLWSVDQPWGISKRIDGVEVSPLGLFHFLPGPLGWRPAGLARR
ncbi:MAG TPA: ABC transporter substrate-binding protein [Thermoanaerobaculia bacterium]|nr:ABC transporter substrate-binding protein [Thermoanaerobaculia bacterium]